MQPDKPFNYWDNTTPNPAPINPPAPQAQPVSAGSPPIPAPIQQPVPAQEPVSAPQPSVAPITQPAPQVAMPVVEGAPAAMYEPEEDQFIDTRQTPTEDTDYYESDDDEATNEEAVRWTASEYVQQEKNSVWFIVFAVIVIGLIALDIFLLKSYTFSALVVVMSIALIVLNRRPPSQINYVLSPQGLYVGEVLHGYDEFRSFGVINDNGSNFIKLIPVKRFSVGVSVYFPTEAGEAIVDILGARIPMEDLKLDVVDTVVRKLRL